MAVQYNVHAQNNPYLRNCTVYFFWGPSTTKKEKVFFTLILSELKVLTSEKRGAWFESGNIRMVSLWTIHAEIVKQISAGPTLQEA